MWQLRLKSLDWSGQVPGGNRRPVPENSGAQSAFFTCWLGPHCQTAQRKRLFEALARDTSRPGAGARRSLLATPPASAIIARNGRVVLQDSPSIYRAAEHPIQALTHVVSLYGMAQSSTTPIKCHRPVLSRTTQLDQGLTQPHACPAPADPRNWLDSRPERRKLVRLARSPAHSSGASQYRGLCRRRTQYLAGRCLRCNAVLDN